METLAEVFESQISPVLYSRETRDLLPLEEDVDMENAYQVHVYALVVLMAELQAQASSNQIKFLRRLRMALGKYGSRGGLFIRATGDTYKYTMIHVPSHEFVRAWKCLLDASNGQLTERKSADGTVVRTWLFDCFKCFATFIGSKNAVRCNPHMTMAVFPQYICTEEFAADHGLWYTVRETGRPLCVRLGQVIRTLDCCTLADGTVLFLCMLRCTRVAYARPLLHDCTVYTALHHATADVRTVLLCVYTRWVPKKCMRATQYGLPRVYYDSSLSYDTLSLRFEPTVLTMSGNVVGE